MNVDSLQVLLKIILLKFSGQSCIFLKFTNKPIYSTKNHHQQKKKQNIKASVFLTSSLWPEVNFQVSPSFDKSALLVSPISFPAAVFKTFCRYLLACSKKKSVISIHKCFYTFTLSLKL